MKHYSTNGLHMWFGSKQESFSPSEWVGHDSAQIVQHPPFNHINHPSLKHLLFLQQTHSTDGFAITSDQGLPPVFTRPGDFLITNLQGVGLGIVTADCLPVIIYHESPRIVALVHAGWRGAVQHIVSKTLHAMNSFAPLNYTNIRVFFGPSAGACCYTVGEEVIRQVQQFPFSDAVFCAKREGTLFDLVFFNQLLLHKEGVLPSACDLQFHACTICTPQYCSYRIEKSTMRQMTVVMLEE